jgi:putative sigma-54 modulation protein
MRITLNGRNIEITKAIKDYVEEKVGRIVKHNNQIINIKVNLSVTKNPSVKKNHTAEVTCFLNGSVVKIKEDAESMYASIDLLADRLDRKVKELKERQLDQKTGKSIRTSEVEPEEEISEEEIYENESSVVIELESDAVS